VLIPVAGVTSQAIRLRQASSAEEREQSRLLVWALSVALAVALVLIGLKLVIDGSGLQAETINDLDRLAFLVFPLLFAVLPVTLTVVLVRYRLWEIDRVINQTLVYGTLTGVLGVTYVAIVVVLQSALGSVTRGSELAVAVSTLAAAALFRPVRDYIQAFIDRRFYRGKRMEQELRVAQLIQQQFLPRQLPELPGWRVAAYYQPARAVGGDFYDFIDLPDGLLGLTCGDVTDKGVPAALVMAITHSILRGDASRLISPGKVLARVNERLCAEIPPPMFVTCFYGVLDPATGHLRYANAGHNPSLRAHAGRSGRAARHRHAARADARHGLRGAGDHTGSRAEPAVPQRRPGRGARPTAQDVRLPAPRQAGGRDGGRSGAHRPSPARAGRVHRIRVGAGG
jgi:Stage II sporulation protein E (SpoIIE)